MLQLEAARHRLPGTPQRAHDLFRRQFLAPYRRAVQVEPGTGVVDDGVHLAHPVHLTGDIADLVHGRQVANNAVRAAVQEIAPTVAAASALLKL